MPKWREKCRHLPCRCNKFCVGVSSHKPSKGRYAMKTSGKWVRGLVLLLGVLMAGPVLAQATRTWVSGVGDDANPCSRTAPCKTFAGAISKTATGGVIDVLDPGGFGGVTITKSITLENVGEIGGILASG